jgi:inosine/xanthosine triphosphatase
VPAQPIGDEETVRGALARARAPRAAAQAELGVGMDRLTGERNTKHGKGAVGILTRGLVDRQEAYEVILTYALAPFLSPELWARGDSR